MIILNGQEAFASMAAGQQIECRHVGSDLDFDSIRNFPATVFIEADYEFRIAVVYMTIGTMQVPEAISEAPAKGTQCFAPSLLTTELSKSFKWKNSGSDLELLTRGLVHLYEDNAVVHAQALITVSGGSLSKEEPASDTVLPWEDETTALDKTDPVIKKLIDTIDKCASEYELQGVERNLDSNKEKLHAAELDQLKQHIKDKRISFFPPADSVSKVLNTSIDDEQPAKSTDELSVNELRALQEEAEKLVQAQKDDEYQTLLNDLLKRAAAANTPVEATALTKYTKAWTESQRKPLLDAIHKRLSELNPPEASNTEQPPSLMVQIQTAPDLTTLDGLEIDIATRHIDIQPKLMDYVKKRRFELESQGGEAAL